LVEPNKPYNNVIPSNIKVVVKALNKKYLIDEDKLDSLFLEFIENIKYKDKFINSQDVIVTNQSLLPIYRIIPTKLLNINKYISDFLHLIMVNIINS